MPMIKLVNIFNRKSCLFYILLIPLFILLVFLPRKIVWAESIDKKENLIHEQRKIFKEAHDALQRKDKKTYQKKYKQLDNYPIKHHLLGLELLQRIRSFPRDDIRNYLDKYSDTAISADVRYYWLETLRKNNKWQDYLIDYKDDRATTKQKCFYQQSKIKKGGEDEKSGVQNALKLWTSGSSQPKACDKLFAILIKNNLISGKIAWERFTKVISLRKYQLAKYVLRFIDDDDKKLAAKLFEIYKNKNIVLNSNFFTEKELDRNPIEIHDAITYGLLRLAKKNSQSALSAYQTYQKKYSFSTLQKNRINSSIIKGLYEQDKKENSDRYLTKYIDSTSSKIIEWRVRQSFKIGDWQDAKMWIKKMPPNLKNKQVWRYWSQRLAELTDDNLSKNYQNIYKDLSKERSFYGFLSAQKLGLGNNMNFEDSTPSKDDLSKLEALAGIKSTRELLYHKLNLSARREWNKTTRNFSKKQWVSAAHISNKWLWYNGTITSMIKAGYWNDTNLRFPLAFKKIFSKYSKKNQIPLNLLMALARQESSFHDEATSPAGAKGLMQLMPATAQEVAGRNNISFEPVRGLYNPEINISLGSLYLKRMLERFDDNRILAIAAYNAGPTRVDRWRKKTVGKIPFDAWIETIPFNETRNYVQNVLAFSAIYAKKLNAKEHIINDQEMITRL